MAPKLKGKILGEDVELTARYEDSSGTAIDPDDVDADAGATPDAYITITKQGSATPVVDSAAMTYVATGEFSYVWDTSVNNEGTGTYVVEATADFGGNTDIERVNIPLK